jgi:hypothetical protein
MRVSGTTALSQAHAAAKRRATVIAVAFAVAWLLILLAGADHPPPLGFLWLLPMLLVGALLVYWRATAYAMWKSQSRPWRVGRVIAEGMVAGLVVAIVLRAVPWSGEPGIRVSATGTFIWLVVVGAIGSANAFVAYFLAARSSV